MTRIAVVMPRGQLEEMCRGLRTSHRVVAADIAHTRREQPRSERIALKTAQVAELTNLPDQLSGPATQDREVNGDYEPLRGAACDALVSASERLASAVHGYWRAATAHGE